MGVACAIVSPVGIAPLQCFTSASPQDAAVKTLAFRSVVRQVKIHAYVTHSLSLTHSTYLT